MCDGPNSIHTGVRIGFSVTDYKVDEGKDLVVEVDRFQGLLFGPVLVSVTPIACSDYEGDLSLLFTDVPAKSADPGIFLLFVGLFILIIFILRSILFSTNTVY